MRVYDVYMFDTPIEVESGVYHKIKWMAYVSQDRFDKVYAEYKQGAVNEMSEEYWRQQFPYGGREVKLSA